MVIIDFLTHLEQIIAQASQQAISDISPLSSVSSVDLELLKDQIDFFYKTNTQLGDSFNLYVSSFYKLVLGASIVVGVLGTVAGIIFGKTLIEAKKTAEEIVEREVEKSIKRKVGEEIEIIRRSFEKERIIDITKVNYFLDGEYNEPYLCGIIRDRKFKSVNFYGNFDELNRNRDFEVLVLDFVTKDYLEPERERIVKKIIALHNKSSVNFTLVIYVPFGKGRLSDELQKLLDDNDIFSTPANAPITVMGRVVDAAQMSFALRQ
ncbi:MAG: hypothetical protein AAGA80_14375 [Cyanobacteria bacterium P01_F01_bin.143]